MSKKLDFSRVMSPLEMLMPGTIGCFDDGNTLWAATTYTSELSPVYTDSEVDSNVYGGLVAPIGGPRRIGLVAVRADTYYALLESRNLSDPEIYDLPQGKSQVLLFGDTVPRYSKNVLKAVIGDSLRKKSMGTLAMRATVRLPRVQTNEYLSEQLTDFSRMCTEYLHETTIQSPE